MRVFGGLRAFYYLQTLLTGDNETGRNPARFHTRGPLHTINFQENDDNQCYYRSFFYSIGNFS